MATQHLVITSTSGKQVIPVGFDKTSLRAKLVGGGGGGGANNGAMSGGAGGNGGDGGSGYIVIRVVA